MARDTPRTPPPPPEDPGDRTDRVGDTLRSIFDEVLAEGVPKDMLDLLKKLD